MLAKVSGAVELTYGEVLYDYFVFVTFVPSPMILTSGAFVPSPMIRSCHPL